MDKQQEQRVCTDIGLRGSGGRPGEAHRMR